MASAAPAGLGRIFNHRTCLIGEAVEFAHRGRDNAPPDHSARLESVMLGIVKLMSSRAFVAIAAVCLAGVLLPRPEAVARGGAGFHGGGTGASHMEGHFEGQHRDEDRGRTDRDRTDRERRDKDRADRDRADRDRADRDRRDMERSDMDRSDMGHWHQSASFGDNGRSSSRFDGQWHVESDTR